MGYGTAYASDMISYITPREARFLDRLFVKALRNTSFGRKEKERIEAGQKSGEDLVFTLDGKDIDRMHGAETLYNQTGFYFFGDNEFAFRRFNDAPEYSMPLSAIQKLHIGIASPKILERLPESLDKALVEIERRCAPSRIKPDAVYDKPEFRDGAWQLYVQAQKLVPEVLTNIHDRRTIQRRFETEQNRKPVDTLELLIEYR